MIEGIQYLRAIAALLVVAYHGYAYFGIRPAWTEFGATGVDLFFVISGFVICHATRHFAADAPRGAQVIDFLQKRFVRVVPLYWLALLWTAKLPLLHGRADSRLLEDFFFIAHHHYLLPEHIWPIVVPGWTINYEVFFYLLFALSMLFGASRYRMLALVMGTLVAAGFVIHGSSAPALFYTSSILLEFMMGMLVYQWYRTLGRHIVGRRWALPLMLLGWALLAIDDGNVARAFADGPCAALIVASSIVVFRGVSILWLKLLGDASYSIYLSHELTFGISDALCRTIGLAEANTLDVTLVLAIKTAVAIVLGVALHRIVEQPLLVVSQRLVSRLRLGRPALAG